MVMAWLFGSVTPMMVTGTMMWFGGHRLTTLGCARVQTGGSLVSSTWIFTVSATLFTCPSDTTSRNVSVVPPATTDGAMKVGLAVVPPVSAIGGPAVWLQVKCKRSRSGSVLSVPFKVTSVFSFTV